MKSWVLIIVVSILILVIILAVILLCKKPKKEKFTSSNIPYTLGICFDKKEKIPQSQLDNWTRLNPGLQIKTFGDKECTEFLRTEYGQSYADLFNEIPWGAIKADLWRICYLYKRGGFYADVDTVPLVPLKDFVGDADFLTSLGYRHGRISQDFIMAKKGSPILKKCIDIFFAKRGRKDLDFWGWSGCTDMTSVLKEEGGFVSPKSESNVYALTGVQDFKGISGEKVRILKETCKDDKNHPWGFDPYSCGKHLGKKLIYKARANNYWQRKFKD